MLGELLGEHRGRTVSRRVLPDGKLEVTQEGKGKLLGLDVFVVATATNQVRPDGSVYSEGYGQGITGEGAVNFRTTAVGWPISSGAMKVRGAFYPWTNSVSQKLMRLNTMVGIVEIEVDPEGNYVLKAWEWK